MRVWSCIVGVALLVVAGGLGGALFLVLSVEGEAPLWQLVLALCCTCVPCCTIGGVLALLSGILEVDFTPKAFACDLLPEDAMQEVMHRSA
mmetsp:Transcript_52962/g.113559  ORF Transcript_52962/g.113559 Transcript_52962/m.113559 type:complete len:91 (+) Transcript_52962:45-317(+)